MRSAVSFSEFSENRDLLKVTVDWDEAGTIHVPYLHKRYGLTFFSTETLRPRSEPFHLVRELARGQLSRVLKRLNEWQSRGLQVPAYLFEAVHEGIVRMTELAVLSDTTPGFDEKANAVFESLVYLSHLLLDQFIEQSLVARKTQSAEFPIFLGFRAKRTQKFSDFSEKYSEYKNVFEAWNPWITWKDVEPEEGVFRWDELDSMADVAQKNHWQIFLGPLVRWDRLSLPHWVVGRLDDPYSVRKSLFRYAEALIRRYPFVSHWIVSSGIASDLDSILVSKRIEWADAMARIIRSVNPTAKILIGIDRPWGDTLRFESEIPPLELGERLAPSRYVDGFLLSLNFGLSSVSTLPRDAFELNWLLDMWSQLGKPLYFAFSIPSYTSFDVPHWETPNSVELPWTLKTQQEQVQRFFLSFLTRKSISGVFWNQLEDIPVQKVPPALFGDSQEDTKTFLEMTRTFAPSASSASEVQKPVDEDATDILTESTDTVFLTGEPMDRNPKPEPKKPRSKKRAGSKTPPPVPDPQDETTELKPPEILSLEDEPNTLDFSFPHSGLINADGKAKPAFKKLAALQRAYLG